MADTSLLQPNLVRDLKFSAGSTAIITLGGIATAMLAVLIVWIVQYYDKTFIVLGCAGALVSAFVLASLWQMPSDVSLSLLSYVLVFAAIFVGFIYDFGNMVLFGITFEPWIIQLISVGMVAAACILQVPYLVKFIKLSIYVLVPIIILGILAHYEIITNWLFMVLTISIIVFVICITILMYATR